MAPRKETALVPIQTAAMLERKTTPELSFTNGRRAGHPADPPRRPQTKEWTDRPGLTFSAWSCPVLDPDAEGCLKCPELRVLSSCSNAGLTLHPLARPYDHDYSF